MKIRHVMSYDQGDRNIRIIVTCAARHDNIADLCAEHTDFVYITLSYLSLGTNFIGWEPGKIDTSMTCKTLPGNRYQVKLREGAPNYN